MQGRGILRDTARGGMFSFFIWTRNCIHFVTLKNSERSRDINFFFIERRVLNCTLRKHNMSTRSVYPNSLFSAIILLLSVSVTEASKEVQYSFSQEPYVSPVIIEHMVGPISDTGVNTIAYNLSNAASASTNCESLR